MQLPLSPPEPVLTNLSYPQLHESGLDSTRTTSGFRPATSADSPRQIPTSSGQKPRRPPAVAQKSGPCLPVPLRPAQRRSAVRPGSRQGPSCSSRRGSTAAAEFFRPWPRARDADGKPTHPSRPALARSNAQRKRPTVRPATTRDSRVASISTDRSPRSALTRVSPPREPEFRSYIRPPHPKEPPTSALSSSTQIPPPTPSCRNEFRLQARDFPSAFFVSSPLPFPCSA